MGFARKEETLRQKASLKEAELAVKERARRDKEEAKEKERRAKEEDKKKKEEDKKKKQEERKIKLEEDKRNKAVAAEEVSFCVRVCVRVLGIFCLVYLSSLSWWRRRW